MTINFDDLAAAITTVLAELRNSGVVNQTEAYALYELLNDYATRASAANFQAHKDVWLSLPAQFPLAP